MDSTYTAFLGSRRLATGSLAEVARAVAQAVQQDPGHAPLLVFDDASARTAELDLRGTPDEVAQRAEQHSTAGPAPEAAAPAPATRGRGRPQLGVVAREVTLLPRHWEWLALQPGGASVALRKLIDEARRTSAAQDSVRAAQERSYRFLSAIAGNLPGFEEALRALFGGKGESFAAITAPWPADVQAYARQLAAPAFAG
ncbi:DUF2239 family protein [uncultured Ramlibacter sp.]|uniref:DUF2239 family protein n=1 Tax=uncultured Ramlibacter sp. TaxID=260755 RepID=UPI0026354434|nr:DUF2239 family protein [uncultured Ramlibacter sp.]